MNDNHHTHLDEIDQFLFDSVRVQPGCCSSIESVKYTVARTVAEALWPKKDLALTRQDMKAVIEAEGSIYDEHHGVAEEVLETYPTEEAFYGEILKRFNEQRNGK